MRKLSVSVCGGWWRGWVVSVGGGGTYGGGWGWLSGYRVRLERIGESRGRTIPPQGSGKGEGEGIPIREGKGMPVPVRGIGLFMRESLRLWNHAADMSRGMAGRGGKAPALASEPLALSLIHAIC